MVTELQTALFINIGVSIVVVVVFKRITYDFAFQRTCNLLKMSLQMRKHKKEKRKKIRAK